MAHPPNGADGSPVGDEVLWVGKVLSQKFVPEPEADVILRDLLEALEILARSIQSTVFCFRDWYYLYTGGEDNVDDRGLTIGGCASAFLADLVISWLFYRVEDWMSPSFIMRGMYRDDAFLVFKDCLSRREKGSWLFKFQAKVNKLCGSSFLKFEAVIWQPGVAFDDGYVGRVRVYLLLHRRRHLPKNLPKLENIFWISQ